MAPLRAWLAACVAAAAVTTTCGIRFAGEVELSQSAPFATIISGFGTAPGAQFRVNADVDADVVFLIEEASVLAGVPARLVLAYGSAAGLHLCAYPAQAKVALPLVKQNATTVLNGTFGHIDIMAGHDPSVVTLQSGGPVSVVMVQCDAGFSRTVRVDVSLTNPRDVVHGFIPPDDAALRFAAPGQQHLSVNQGNLPLLFAASSVTLAALVVGWAAYLTRFPTSRLTPIHGLLGVWMVALGLNWLVSVGRWNAASTQSPQLRGWEVAAGLMGVLANIVFIVTNVWVAAGLGSTFRALHRRTAGGMLCLLCTYTAAGVASTLCEEDGEPVFLGATGCETLTLTEFVLFSLAVLCIIIIVNWTVNALRVEIVSSTLLRTTRSAYGTMKALQVCRLFFLAYLMLPTLNLILSLALLEWYSQWASTLLLHALNIGLLLFLFRAFGPARAGSLGALQNMLVSASHAVVPVA